MRIAAVAVLVLACPFYLGAVQSQPDVPRAVDGRASRTVVRLLAKSDSQAVARALAYPASYSQAEREADIKGVAGSLGVLFAQLGQLSAVTPESEFVEFYEVGVGTGPSPFWWQSTEPPARTRQYIYRTNFSRAGPGFVKVLTRVAGGTEEPVSVFFGLSVELPTSKAQVDAAYQALLDSVGLPPDHPARTQPAQLWQSPPASQE